MSKTDNSKSTDDSQSYSTVEVEAKFVNAHKIFLGECKTQGEEDGRRALPTIDSTFLQPFEKEVLEKYQSEISRVSGVGGEMLQEIYDKRVKPIEKELENYASDSNFIPEKIRIAGEDRDRFLKEASENHDDKLKEIENEPSWTNAHRDFKHAATRFEEVSRKLSRRELHVHIKPILYIFVLIFIGICEIPINYQVFVSFRETPLLTLIMAGVLVISLPLLAHSSGKFLRQYKENKNYLWLLGIAVIMILVLSYFTADLRQGYLATKDVPGAQLARDFWIFFIISLILFFVGSIVSYFSHDPSIEFAEVFRTYASEKKIYDKKNGEKHKRENLEREKFSALKNKIQEEYTKKKSEWDSKIQTLSLQHSISVSEHDKLLAFFQSLERRISDSYKEAIHLYRHTNLTYRNNHKSPQYWENELPDLKFYFANYKELSLNPKI